MNDDLLMFDFTDNDEVELEAKDFEPLPAGKYPFEIVTYDKSIYEKRRADSKVPDGCKVATVHFKLDASAVGRGEYTVKENYYLCGGKGLEVFEGKLRGLFEGVGLLKKDQKRFRIDFDKLIGMSGTLKLTLDADKKDPSKSYNHVKSIDRKPDDEYSFG